MAINSHNASRREMLAFISGTATAGAMLTSAAISGASPALAAPSHQWDSVHADYRRAQQAMDDFDRQCMTPAEARHEAWRKRWLDGEIAQNPHLQAEYAAESAHYDDVENQYNAMVNQRDDAAMALIKVPAPHSGAVAEKFEIMIAEEYWNCHGFEDVTAQILADLRRLGGN